MDKEEKGLTTLDEEGDILDDPFFNMELWKFDQSIAVYICDELRTGTSLKKILAKPGLPPYKTVVGWSKQFPQFLAAMDESRAAIVPMLHDDIIEAITGDDILDRDELAAKRFKVDNAWKMVEKLRPDVYGNKGNQVDINIATQVLVDTGITREPPVGPVVVETKENEHVLPPEDDEGPEDEH